MKGLIERLFGLSPKKRVLLWVGSLLLLTYLFWQYYYSTKIDEYSELSQTNEQLQGQIATEMVIVSSLPKFRKEVDELNALYKIAVSKLPQKREIPNLLDTVSSLAKDAGLEVRRFAPQTDVIKDFYAEIPVNVEMKGSYHNVAIFFDELSRFSRIINIDDINFANPRAYTDSTEVDLDVKGVLKAFRYLEPQERKEKDDQSKSDKAKRK